MVEMTSYTKLGARVRRSIPRIEVLKVIVLNVELVSMGCGKNFIYESF